MRNTSEDLRKQTTEAKTSDKFTIDQVQTLLWSRTLEQKALEKKSLTADDITDCSTEAARRVGENASARTYLLARCELLLKEIQRLDPKLVVRSPTRLSSAVWVIGAIIYFLAFLCGILTDQFTAAGNRINLMSPPLLLFFLWNILVYLALVIFFIGRRIRKSDSLLSDPIRKIIGFLITKVQTFGAKKAPLLSAFYRQWLPMELPLLNRNVAAILHGAAMLFALGFVASLAVRAWGTAYQVGWESTWFAESPEFVKAFLSFVYGHIPLADNLAANWDVETVRNMRFDIGSHSMSAGAWLARLITVTTLVVIIPRLLLALYNRIMALLLKKNFPINLQSPYYLSLLRQWQGKSMTIQAIPFGKELTAIEKEALSALTLALNQTGTHLNYGRAVNEESELPAVNKGEYEEIWIIYSMASTPENEVHIQFARDVNQRCTQANTLCRIIVNSDTFEERFAKTPKRIEERKANWSAFLKKTGIAFAFANLSHIDTKSVIEQFERNSAHI